MAFASNRRLFFRLLTAAMGSAASTFGKSPGIERSEPGMARNEPGLERNEKCCAIRSAAAAFHKSLPEEAHPVNGDERLSPNGALSFSKALPHNSRGEPLPEFYRQLAGALDRGSFGELEALLLGGSMKLSNPLAQDAFELEGPDSHQLGIAAPPAFGSAEQAGEMVELYWQALTRDIPFARWAHDETIAAAAADLNAREDFRGPKGGGRVTAQTLFRIDAPGVMDGPYLSQFLLKPVPYGNLSMEQRYRVAAPGRDFGQLFKYWLAMQNGVMTMEEIEYGAIPTYIATQRGLAGFVHRDYTYQAFLSAALILSRYGPAALNDTNPYKRSQTQAAFRHVWRDHRLSTAWRERQTLR